nr:metallophosphoesterase [Cytophagales bacterium]
MILFRYILPLLLTCVVIFSSVAQEVRVYKAPKFRYEWSKPSYYPDRIALNFGENPAKQVNVTWRTDTTIQVAKAEIAVATASPKFWRNGKTLAATTSVFDGARIKEAEVTAHFHSVAFTDLIPDTVYAYRVGDGETWSEWFQFRTASDNKADKFSFLYVGDAQNYILELWARLIREGYRKAPEAKFIIHAGDLINHAHREQEWHEWFTAGGFIHSMLPSVPTPGNHEYRSIPEIYGENSPRQLSAQWRHQFTLPENGPEGLEETVYYMDYQDVRLISLNSNVEHQKQAEWVEKVLADNPQKWTILTYHHPLFSASDGRDNTELRELWKPIFDKYNVDLALQGHDHSYARGRVSPEDNVLDGVNMRDKTGTVYVVSVSGGKMYGLNPNRWTDLEAEQDRAAENTQLFQVITVNGNKLHFEAYTAIGELYDAFDLIKEDSGINTFIERKHEAVEERLFSNTISYEDQLPDSTAKKLLATYPGFVVSRVNAYERDGKVVFQVRLVKDSERIDVAIDSDGKAID